MHSTALMASFTSRSSNHTPSQPPPLSLVYTQEVRAENEQLQVSYASNAEKKAYVDVVQVAPAPAVNAFVTVLVHIIAFISALFSGEGMT